MHSAFWTFLKNNSEVEKSPVLTKTSGKDSMCLRGVKLTCVLARPLVQCQIMLTKMLTFDDELLGVLHPMSNVNEGSGKTSLSVEVRLPCSKRRRVWK